MLLYVIESSVPLLTIVLIITVVRARKREIERHMKIAKIYVGLTFASYAIVMTLTRLGYSLEGDTPKWIGNAHFATIYAIPVLLLVLVYSGLKGKGALHKPIALLYILAWAGALVTGSLIFASARHWI
jgi:uncharacterized membrane protein YozB (DUF420 family)